MDVRGGGDRQIEGAAARFAAALGHGGVQPAALARDFLIEGQRIEAILDDREAANADRPGLLVGRHQDAEVKLREGGSADRSVLGWPVLGRDQDRGIQQDGHL